MEHAREDYDVIQAPTDLIPADEPVFLLRARDMFAPGLMHDWAHKAAEAGVAPEMVMLVLQHAERMIEYRKHNGGPKLPDLPAKKKTESPVSLVDVDDELLKMDTPGSQYLRDRGSKPLRETSLFKSTPETAPIEPPAEPPSAPIEPPVNEGNTDGDPADGAGEQEQGLRRPPAEEDDEKAPVTQGDAKRDAESAAQEIRNLPSPARPAGDDKEAPPRETTRGKRAKTGPTE